MLSSALRTRFAVPSRGIAAVSAVALVCGLSATSPVAAAQRRAHASRGCAKGATAAARSGGRGRSHGAAAHARPGHRCAAAPTSRVKRPTPSRPVAPGRPVRGPVTGPPPRSTPGPGGGSGEPVKPPRGREPSAGLGGLPQDEGSTVTNPIDPRFLTKDPFGASSFWIQPWRAYVDTWPSSTLLNSLGINFNVEPKQAEAVARLLQESGFTLARREIPWGGLSYEDPTRFSNEPRIASILTAMKNHSLRPLILLNANSGQPGPAKRITLTTTAPALPGAMTVKLDEASAAAVVPGKTGFDGLTWGTGPDVLVTSVAAGGIATLSRPLRSPLPAGSHLAMTLLYAPFQNPKLANGEPNPAFQETLAGWISYVATVNAEATRILGAGGYDLEVWNELTFGSQFLNYQHYYQPADSRTAEAEAAGALEPQDAPAAPEDAETPESPETRATTTALDGIEAETEAGDEGEGSEPLPSAHAAPGIAQVPAAELEDGPERKDLTKATIDNKVTKAVIRTLLKETVSYVRNPANGISSQVGISDGFASQTPFPSGALAPAGMTALSKHLYNGSRQLPLDYKEKRIRPLDAFGFRDTEGGRGFKPLFVPEFQSLFPEYFLTAMSTETIVRDIAPITTRIYGLEHGRNVGPAGGAPVQKWMTEYNLSAGHANVMQADGVTPAGVTPTAADRAHLEAKALMRSLVAMVNKGMSREYFYAAAPGALSLIDNAFYSALEAHPETYPGAGLGGETMSGFRQMLAQFTGPGPQGAPRQLQLLSITQEGNHAQFAGDGTAAHPSLYDRDVLAVMPFQSSPTRFVIPVYVMTRDLLTLYEPGRPANEVQRFDLPQESFKIKLGNLPESAAAPSVGAYDPLRGTSTPARLLSRQGSSAEFEVAATDYPRLLTLDYSGA